MRMNGPNDASGSMRQFKELISLVAQPQSAIKYEQPGISAEVRQSPPGVFDFRMIEGGPNQDLVVLSVQTDKEGNPVRPLQLQTRDINITPAVSMAGDLFFGRIIQPLHRFLFKGKND